MFELEVFEARVEDYVLTPEQKDLAESYRKLLARECSPDRVRSAATSGFDPDLWQRLCEQGSVAMAVPDEDAASLVDIALVAEEMGAAMAPVPYIEAVVAVRLLGRLIRHEAPRLSSELRDAIGSRVRSSAAGDDLTLFAAGRGSLAGVGPAAHVVRRFGHEIRIDHREPVGEPLANVAGLPLVNIDNASGSTVLASGETAAAVWRAALDEWRVLTACAYAGLIRTMQEISVEFAKTRQTRGVSIATLQGVSFPLADTEIARETTQHLARRAAWYLEHEPSAHPELAPAALIHAARSARATAETGVHILAGQGVSLESDITLAFGRAQAWALVGERPRDLIEEIAALVVDTVDR